MDEAEVPFPLTVVILGLLGGSILVWQRVFARRRQGMSIIPRETREPAPWNAMHLIAVIGVYITVQAVVGAVVIAGYRIAILGLSVDKVFRGGAELSPADLAPVLLANALANLIVVGMAAGLLNFTSGATARDFGFSPWRPAYDIPLGVAAFLASLLPVYAIQAVLTQFFPSKHPVMQLLTEDSSAAMLLLTGFSAVVVAPIAEEFLFRGILQGWLEAAVGGHEASEMEPSERESTLSVVELQPEGVAAAANAEIDQPAAMSQPPTAAQRFLPIGVSSFLFAIVHWGNGPDPIPLFVLAVILGYLYQQTHRLWPCIVLHMCLNATSLTMLLASLD